MQNLRPLLTEITELTNTIESDYPELYRYLDENPLTLPTKAHPEMGKKALQDYLETLQQLFAHHLETHKNRRE